MSRGERIGVQVGTGGRVPILMRLSFSEVVHLRCLCSIAGPSVLSRSPSSLDGGRDEACGHGSLSFSGDKAFAFVGMCLSLAVLSICDFMNISVGLVKRGEFSVRRVNAFMNDGDCVQRLMLRVKALFNLPFLAIVASVVSVYE